MKKQKRLDFTPPLRSIGKRKIGKPIPDIKRNRRGESGWLEISPRKFPNFPLKLNRHLRKIFDLSAFCLIVVAIKNLVVDPNNQAFWLDEIWRVDLVLAPNLFSALVLNPSSFTAITSPIFATLTRTITLVFGVSPNSIRLILPIAALVLSILVYLYIRKFSSLLAFLIFYFLLFNPQIKYWTLEFKPFVFDALVVVVIFLAWFDLISSEVRSSRKITRVFLLLLFGLASSIVTVFIIPGIFFTLFLLEKRSELAISGRRIIAMAAGVCCQTTLMYLCFWRYAKSDPGMQSFWNAGFHNNSEESYLSFIIRAFKDPILNSYQLEGVFALILLSYLWVASLVRTRKSSPQNSFKIQIFFIFLALFFLTLVVANFFRFWPLGDIRVNLFVKIFFVVSICAGSLLFGHLNELGFIGYANSIFVILLLSIATIQNAQSEISKPVPTHPQYVMNSFIDSSQIANEILDSCRRTNSAIVLSPAMGFQFNYYSKYDSKYSKVLKTLSGKCVTQIPMSQSGEISEDEKKRVQYILSNNGRIYWLFSGVSKEDINAIRSEASLMGEIMGFKSFKGTDGFFEVSG